MKSQHNDSNGKSVGALSLAQKKAFPISKPRQLCPLLGLEASWAIFSYLQTLCKAHFWGRFIIMQEASSAGDSDLGNQLCPFCPHFLTLPLVHTAWVEPGSPWHLRIQTLWSKHSSYHSKVSICFYTFPWCSTPTFPKRYHICHTVCLLIDKAYILLLLTFSLLVIEHILWKGSR